MANTDPKKASRVGSLLDALTHYGEGRPPQPGEPQTVEDQAGARFINDAIYEMVPTEGREGALRRAEMKKMTQKQLLEGKSYTEVAEGMDKFVKASRAAEAAATKKSSGFKMSGMKFYDKDYK
tara:strand:+ start:64 stop:432 length:369 start_codon:yes stop_codon:yes gene_type:complete